MDIEELKTTARLAMLELHEEESAELAAAAELAAIAELAAAVSGMLENFSLMQKVDISGLEPTTHALSEQNSGREDVIVSAEGPGKAEGPEKTENSGKAEAYNLNNPENLIERAPEYDNNHIVIPNVL